MKKRNIGFIILIILAIIGILDSSYLLKLKLTDSASFCDQLVGFDCGTVNKGAYSEFPPWTFTAWVDAGLPTIPNSTLGIIGFVFVLVMSLYALSQKNKKKIHKITKIILIFLTISFIYGLYLIYIQKFVLRTWCLFCLVLDAVILLSLITAYMMYKKR